MSLLYSIVGDIVGTVLFFYLPGIYILETRKGNRYANCFLSILLFQLIRIPIRYNLIRIESIAVYYAIQILAILIIFTLLYRDKFAKKVVCVVLMYAVAFCTDLLCVCIYYYILPGLAVYEMTNSENTNIMQLSGQLCSTVTTMVCTLVYLCLIRKRNLKMFLGFILLPVYQLCLMFGFLMLCSDFTERTAVIGMIMNLSNVLLDGLVLHFIDGILKKLDWEKEISDIEKKRRQEYCFYEKESRQIEQIRMIRHDFVNQLQTVYNLIDENENADEVKRILEEMKKRIEV